MTRTITPVSKMVTLVKREYQEQRVLFLYLPVLGVLMITVAFLVNAIRSYGNNVRFIGLIGNRVPAESRAEVATALQGFSGVPFDVKARFWEQFYNQTLPLLYVCFWGVMLYYYQMSLFSQRRDRSILFWNSFPISSSETVFSKLIAGFFLCHMIYVFSFYVLHLLMLLVMMGYGAMFDMNLWSDIVEPSGIIHRFGRMLIFTFLAVFWCLPIYAWLMLTSACAKSAPFAWAMAPIVVIILSGLLFFDTVAPVGILLSHVFPVDSMGISPQESFSIWHAILSTEMLVSVGLGAIFVGATIRFNRSEDI